VSEWSLGLSGTQIYIDDKNVTTLITLRIKRIQGGRTSVAAFRGRPLVLYFNGLSDTLDPYIEVKPALRTIGFVFCF
jgi:hypothetical protein